MSSAKYQKTCYLLDQIQEKYKEEFEQLFGPEFKLSKDFREGPAPHIGMENLNFYKEHIKKEILTAIESIYSPKE